MRAGDPPRVVSVDLDLRERVPLRERSLDAAPPRRGTRRGRRPTGGRRSPGGSRVALQPSTIRAPSGVSSTQTASGVTKRVGHARGEPGLSSASGSVAGWPSVGPLATADGNAVGRPGIVSIVSAPRSITTFAATAASASSTTPTTTSSRVRLRRGSDRRGRASDGTRCWSRSVSATRPDTSGIGRPLDLAGDRRDARDRALVIETVAGVSLMSSPLPDASSSLRSRPSARDRRDLTVPGRTPRASAISASDSSNR